GTVLAQTPTGNRKVAKGTTVNLVVSKSALVEVPRVIGMNVDDAEQLLRSLGFAVEIQDVPGFSDRVVDQNPEPGEQVPYGSTITLRVF
ncbi:MAG TPA: PASTA domain-containing protein, partial [Sporichthya sp.]|nr:PASTA domain-containing protein [Sporichthya sp.]